jgi:hypothetical protein
MSKNVAGKVPDNPISSQVGDRGLRESLVQRGFVKVKKRLSRDFALLVKHNARFAAILDNLARRYRCYAIIRNPLATLSSWQSVDMPIQRGHSPAPEDLDPRLKADLSALEDVEDRQFYNLDWFFWRFKTMLPGDHIIRYEEVVKTGGRSLVNVRPEAAQLEHKLESRNCRKLYDHEKYQKLGERLLRTEGVWWDFNERSDVEKLLEKDPPLG